MAVIDMRVDGDVRNAASLYADFLLKKRRNGKGKIGDRRALDIIFCERNFGALRLDGKKIGAMNAGGANLYRASIKNAYLRGMNFGGANLGYANITGSDCECANFGGANLGYAKLARSSFRGANMSGAYLAYSDLSNADFSDAYFWGAYMKGAVLRNAVMEGSYLGGVDLKGADLRGARLLGAEMHGASVSRVKLYRKDFRTFLESVGAIGRGDNITNASLADKARMLSIILH